MNRFSRRKLLKLAAPALILSAAPKLVRATQLPVSTLSSPLAYPAGVPTGFDPSHPASRNCWLSTAVNSGATGAYNILTGKPGTINGTPTFVQDSVIGPSIKYSNATDSTEFSGFSTNATNSLLFAAIFRAPTAQAANQFIVTNTAGSATGILYLTLTTNLVSMQLGGSLTYTSTLGCTAGRWYFIVACGPNSTVAECNIVVLDLLNGET